ncbi:MAG: tryptophan synthase subunit alpha [bacterium]|nr:tryptophan synthase subunit alpha [bacterium]
MSTEANGANRIDLRLTAAAGHGALMPYLTGGYPDLDATAEWIRRFDRRGVAAVEIGFPYSDSIADGPVIQDSFYRVLEGGQKTEQLFEMVAALRSQVQAALVAMVSFSIVRRVGTEAFVHRAADAGFDGLIIPDIPYEESSDLGASAAAHQLRHVMLVAPTTPAARAEEIARRSSGFVYLVSTRGITGERDELPHDLRTRVEHLRAVSSLPVCVGFGIGTAEHVRQVCTVADGAIVGSAIVRRITDALDAGQPRDAIVESVAQFVEGLADGVG